FNISLNKHLYVFPSGDRELEIFETWPPNGGTNANKNSVVEFLIQYQVTLTNQLTATHLAYSMELRVRSPIESGVRYVPFADHLPDLIDGTYSALVEAKVWKKIGIHTTHFWTDTTTGTVFVLVNAHRGFAIASPTAETSALTDVTDLYPVGPDEPPRMAGVIIPPGAVTQPTLVWVDPVINDEDNWLEGQTGPLYSFGPETTFARPVTLVIPYDASLNELDGVREVMNLMANVGPGGALEPLLFTNIDIYSDTVTATTTHFSFFGIFRAINAVVTIFRPVIQLAAAVIGVVISVIVQATQASYNDMYTSLIKPFRELNFFDPNPCYANFDACLFGLSSNAQAYRLASDAYAELFSANVPEHFLDQNPWYGSRKERVRQLIHSSLVLLSWEAANFGLNEGLNKKYKETLLAAPYTGPFQHRNYDPTGTLIGMRGWGSKDHKVDDVPIGWMTFPTHTGAALIGILETALAVRQFVAEDPTPCLANSPVFQENTDPCNPIISVTPSNAASYLGVKDLRFINPNRSDNDAEINDCLNKWVANGRVLAGADTGCFSISQNLGKLTYAETDALITTFGKQVMDWWIRNASTEITSDDPAWGYFGHYFWYYAQGSQCLYKKEDGVCHFPSNQSVVHNVNALMGRAAFLLYRLTNEDKYRDIAKRVQRVYQLAHFPCREEGTRYMSSCHAYGALKSWVRTQPSSPKSWGWYFIKDADGNKIYQTEDIEHAGSSAALNG
ncbi:MAG: hypothetical protein H0X02_13120, partial [Nitrosomonas sp.]|nr:hypothetical protein [Nitrosomonas sp.]